MRSAPQGSQSAGGTSGRPPHSSATTTSSLALSPVELPRAATVNTLLSRKSSFASVHISRIHISESSLSSWPALFVERKIEDLVFVNVESAPFRHLPTDIFKCTNLRKLYLGHFRFPSELHDGVILPCLEELVILNCSITQRSLDRTINSAPMLKKIGLVTICSDVVTPLNIYLGGPHLEMVNIANFTGSEINVKAAPRLEKILAFEVFPPETMDLHIFSKQHLDHVKPFGVGREIVKITIDSDASPKVVGYLETSSHVLRIGDIFVKFTTDVSSIAVPSVNVLALKVDLGRLSQARVMISWLRCFPGVETLYIQSAELKLPSADMRVFYEELEPIACVFSSIKRVVVHDFKFSEVEMIFLKYVLKSASLLEKITLVNAEGFEPQENSIVVDGLLTVPLLSKACDLSIWLSGRIPCWKWDFRMSFDVSLEDPFIANISRHCEEVKVLSLGSNSVV